MSKVYVLGLVIVVVFFGIVNVICLVLAPAVKEVRGVVKNVVPRQYLVLTAFQNKV